MKEVKLDRKGSISIATNHLTLCEMSSSRYLIITVSSTIVTTLPTLSAYNN